MSNKPEVNVTVGEAAARRVDLTPSVPAAVEQPLELPAGAVLNADGSVTLTLTKPISVKVGGQDQVFSELIFRDLSGEDLLAVRESGVEAARNKGFFQRSLDMPSLVSDLIYRRMRVKDVLRAEQAVSFFF